MTNYKAVVDAGMAWLAANRPNWRNMIDPDTFNVASSRRCVLGQTGGYDDGLAVAVPCDAMVGSDEWYDKMRERDEWANAHGFRVSVDAGGWFDDEYAALTLEWLTRL